MESEYKIEYLKSFQKELKGILYYITYKLKNEIIAEKIFEDISCAIIKRSNNPEGFEIYKSEKSRTNNWYRIYIRNYTIFYTVKNKTMKIAHIIYCKRNIKNLI